MAYVWLKGAGKVGHTSKFSNSTDSTEQPKGPPPQDPPSQQPPDQQPSDQQSSDQQPADQQQVDQPDLPDHSKIPRIRASAIENHHHHDHLGYQQACLAESCEFNANDHSCQPDVVDRCPCTCRDPDCPVTKERQKARLGRVAINSIVSTAL